MRKTGSNLKRNLTLLANAIRWTTIETFTSRTEIIGRIRVTLVGLENSSSWSVVSAFSMCMELMISVMAVSMAFMSPPLVGNDQF